MVDKNQCWSSMNNTDVKRFGQDDGFVLGHKNLYMRMKDKQGYDAYTSFTK